MSKVLTSELSILLFVLIRVHLYPPQVTFFSGHAWLIIENNSSVNLALGSYRITSGSSATIGAWSVSSSSTEGVVYINKETNSTYSNVVALRVTIEAYEYYMLLDAIDAAAAKLYYPREDENDDMVIDDQDNAYTCVNFALDAWHAIGGTTLTVTSTPKNAVELWAVINEMTHFTPSMPAASTAVVYQ